VLQGKKKKSAKYGHFASTIAAKKAPFGTRGTLKMLLVALSLVSGLPVENQAAVCTGLSDDLPEPECFAWQLLYDYYQSAKVKGIIIIIVC
jgi:hypothetical protein